MIQVSLRLRAAWMSLCKTAFRHGTRAAADYAFASRADARHTRLGHRHGPWARFGGLQLSTNVTWNEGWLCPRRCGTGVSFGAAVGRFDEFKRGLRFGTSWPLHNPASPASAVTRIHLHLETEWESRTCAFGPSVGSTTCQHHGDHELRDTALSYAENGVCPPHARI